MQLSSLTRRLFTNPQIAPAVSYETLARYGSAALTKAYDHGVRITILQPHETYLHHSNALRRLAIDVDTWTTPPAGLFIVEERAMLLRRASAMTIAHEFGHAIDCTLGGGIYRSSIDPQLLRAFASAQRWITPYAATRIDEYFAEAMRAYINANDSSSHWPRATRERLASYDPTLYRYVDELFTHDFHIPAESG